jgi:DNA-binding response OmpR family regulator
MAKTAHEGPGGERTDGGSRILVVDDEEIIHLSLKRILEREGHHVDAVFGAPEALERLSWETYDLVISDLMMPEINGIQLLESMRREGHDVPVLMITGYPTIRTALQALRLGAVDYLSKPFTRKELLGPVHRTLRRPAAEATEEIPSDAGEEGAAPPRVRPGDRFHLRKHSWAVSREDGKMAIGIERSFLDSIDAVASLEAPGESDVIEQGFVGFKLTTASGELHNVFVPLSGQVVEVNEEALRDPGSVGPDTWLVVIVPNRLETELPLLLEG